MARFTATTNAFTKGIENTKPKQGVHLIEDWEHALADADFKGSKGLARDLQSLHKALDNAEPDDKRVRTLMGRLGAATRKAAEQATKGKDNLIKIADALEQAGHPDETADKE